MTRAKPPSPLDLPTGGWKPKRRVTQSEHQLQRAVAQYLDVALPPGSWWTSIDSAGRGPIAGARMKARGVKRGVADLLIIADGRSSRSWTTLWVELKSKNGRLTDDQYAFFHAAVRAGHEYAIIRSVAALDVALRYLGVELRVARMTP